jgi:2-dehydropantoate 2-reductase
MRHAVLGAGGIGGLLAAALARAGFDVVLLMRPSSLDAYDGRIAVESAVIGDFEVAVPAAAALDGDVAVLWVTPKATDLVAALDLAPPAAVGEAVVIPLLNGVDHMATLRARYPDVVAGAIRVESERVAPGRIRQRSPFVRVELAGAATAAGALRETGIECRVRDDELALLWDKLVFLGPLALATTALDGPFGAVRDDPRYRACQEETLAVAAAEGARVDLDALEAVRAAAPAEMRSSMQKDVAAGQPPELDAIAGPILRGGARHGIPVPATGELAELVAERGHGRRAGR